MSRLDVKGVGILVTDATLVLLKLTFTILSAISAILAKATPWPADTISCT